MMSRLETSSFKFQGETSDDSFDPVEDGRVTVLPDSRSILQSSLCDES